MKIIHFSDSHAGGPAEDWLAYLDKRWVGVFNYRFRRQYQHDQSLLSKAVDHILANRPDAVVCTGDLTSTGQPGEFKQALDILRPLIDGSDIPFIFVPGNHDYYVHRKSCCDSLRETFRYLNRDRLRFEDLPAKITVGGLDFLVVNESWPTNLLSSCGYLRKDSRDALMEWCSAPKERPRILVAHFPLSERYPLLRVRHRLWGQKEVLELLRSGRLDLSLCGHVHVPEARIDVRGRGEICAGSVTRNACMASIEYRPGSDMFTYNRIDLEH